MKGSKSAVLGGTDIKLPALNAQDAVGEPQPFWVRFIGDPKEWPGETLPGVISHLHLLPAAILPAPQLSAAWLEQPIPCRTLQGSCT